MCAAPSDGAALGYSVTLFDERPSQGSGVKILGQSGQNQNYFFHNPILRLYTERKLGTTLSQQ